MSAHPDQARLNEIQQLYRQWTQLLPALEAAQQQWQQSIDIMCELTRFYFDGDYRRLLDALENGQALDLRTEGEESVLGEDTLWNAFYEQQQLAWRWLRAAVAFLDREKV